MLVDLQAKATLPTEFGIFDILVFVEKANGKEHVAMVYGNLTDGNKVLSRIHSECLTGDIFHSLKCDCGFQLKAALEAIVQEGRGVLIYHRAEGRGIGLVNKIKAYALQDKGMDTVEANLALGFPADIRDFKPCADIYALLGVHSIELMTNNPRKVATMREVGINVVARRPLFVGKNKYNEKYLEVKSTKLDHMITDEQLSSQNLDFDFDNQDKKD